MKRSVTRLPPLFGSNSCCVVLMALVGVNSQSVAVIATCFAGVNSNGLINMTSCSKQIQHQQHVMTDFLIFLLWWIISKFLCIQYNIIIATTVLLLGTAQQIVLYISLKALPISKFQLTLLFLNHHRPFLKSLIKSLILLQLWPSMRKLCLCAHKIWRIFRLYRSITFRLNIPFI